MSIVTIKQLLEAGVHFGHHTRRWNPKMQEYIFTERNGIYIIDLQKTVKKFEEAYNFVRDLSATVAPCCSSVPRSRLPRRSAKRRSVAVCTTSTSGGRAA